MRLIHNSKDNPRVPLVFGSKLAPETRELSISRPSLAYNRSIPARIIVNVNYTRCTSRQASLDNIIVSSEVVWVQGATENVVDQKLPSRWDSEQVQFVIIDKVRELIGRRSGDCR